MGQRAIRKGAKQDWELQVIPGAYYIDFDKEGSAGKRGKRQAASQKRRKRRKSHRIGRLLWGAGAVCLLAASLPAAGKMLLQERGRAQAERFLEQLQEGSREGYPEELLEMLEKNEETYEFVMGYPDRADYMGKEIDLSGEMQTGRVPLLLQWDMTAMGRI